jgi:hypothetical protein
MKLDEHTWRQNLLLNVRMACSKSFSLFLVFSEMLMPDMRKNIFAGACYDIELMLGLDGEFQ